MRTVALACLALAACSSEDDPTNALSGSIESAGYSLEFDSVRITRDGEQLVVRYEHRTVVNHQTVTNQPVRISVDLAAVVDTAAVDMATEVLLEHAVTTVDSSQQPVDEADFPAVESGRMTLSELGAAVGEPVAGDFSCVFASGFTLTGEFEAELTPPP